MSSHSHAATSGECELCGGPCREPFRLEPVHEGYPFMSEPAIAATHPQPEPEPRRARRRGGDRMRRPETHPRKGEDR